MGIKHAFWWFKNHYKHYMIPMKKEENFQTIGVSIDNLIIDMNGIFHNSAQKIFQYGNHKPKPRMMGRPFKRVLRGLKAQLKLFEDVCLTVENLLDVVQPAKRIIICVDGPAPLSKQCQQRSRRFRSAAEQEEDSPFNSNCITPGTKFMDYLTKYIDWYIRKRINEDVKWRKVEVIFSNEKAPGEGEHKGLQYIRRFGSESESYCIHGLDADLIMLALASHIEKFYILREDTYDHMNEFFCMNIGAIRREIDDQIKWVSDKYEYNSVTAINDFVLLCFMVGNDFLPHIPSIEIIEDGLELIIEVYKEVCSSYGHITHSVDGHIKILPSVLGVFLGTIGQHEQTNLESKLEKKHSFFPDPLLENCAMQRENGKWKVNIEKYREEYMDQSFPSSKTEKEIAHAYMEGMQWVLSYYTFGVPNWEWLYPYHYAPLASVIAKHSDTFFLPRYGYSSPNTPFQQLLCVLPPVSADLIPEPLCKLLTSEKSPLRKFCPEEFEVDLSGKRKEWEGIVILPVVDFALVRECYNRLVSKIDKRDLPRNILGKSFVYQYNPELAYVFKSYYGDIYNCAVRTIPINL